MKIYFLSSQPCALTVGGVFYGVTDTFERSVELSLSDNIYAKFSPEGAEAVGFFLTEEIRSKPPKGCDVYLMKKGIAIYAHAFPPTDFTLRPIAQKREGETLATVYAQGHIQLSVQSSEGFFNAYLPPSFEPCSLSFHRGLVVLQGENTLGVFTKRCEKLLVEQITALEFDEEGVNATLPLSDSLNRRARCRWRFQENECILTSFTVEQPSLENTLPEGLLAYAFFESVLIKANYRDFLSDELQSDCARILDFLGDFIAVTLTKEPNVCGLVYKKAEGLFAVEEFSVQIEKGKIVDIRG